jgi:hypothetical protein
MDIINGDHPWNFRRIGGIYQAQIETVEDLKALPTLDPKLWVALSCPVNDLEIDVKTLAWIDHDADGRVRIEEALTAVEWSLQRLSDPGSLFKGGPLPLAAINTADDEGQALLNSAKQILENIGKSDATHISVDEAANTDKIYGQSRLNGDGVIAQDATDDPLLQKLIQEIGDCLGTKIDRSGGAGITQEIVDTFLAGARSFDSWWQLGEQDSAKGEDIFPLGDATPQAFLSLSAVEKKIDDYFARCALAAFDIRAEEPLNHDVALFKTIAVSDFSEHSAEVARLPIARIAASPYLDTGKGINPEWIAATFMLRETVLKPLGGIDGETLTPELWKQTKARFAGYRKWRAAKPDTGVEPLGIARIREILGSDLLAKLSELLEEDRSIAPKMTAVSAVEKLARYHRDLISVLNNFVNFNDFYDTKTHASFQAGTLYLDGRECRLCLKVADPAKHTVLASLSRAFVAYCECRRKDSPNKFYIAAVFSDGDSANLIVGRNGVFRDHAGKLWDSTIVRMIENPISIREAFFRPYVRIGRFIGEQLEKWATSRDKAMQKQMETGVESVADGKQDANTNSSARNIGGIAGMVAAGGIALGAIGAGLASLFNTFKTLDWWEFPVILFALMLMISFPSMIIAWLKIRKRTLAPLLDASGWAVNGRTLISMKLGRILTRRATVPVEAQCKFDERARGRHWLCAAIAALILAAALGWILFFA